MDDEPHPENEFTSEVTIDEGPAPYAGAFFPSSQNLHVGGGMFSSSVTNNTTNNIQQAAPSLPPDFRMIPLGDIDLRNEIHVNYKSGRVDRQCPRRCVRRMCSAKVEGRKSTMTVKLYQGDNAEEEWREALNKLSCIRHPNFIQIYGAASSQGVHAAIFQDDLIPFDDYLALYCHSPIMTVYIWGFCAAEFQDANRFFQSVFQQSLSALDCQLFIRRSTERLCADVLEAGDVDFYQLPTENRRIPAPENIMILNKPNPDTAVISALTLERYYGTCYTYLRNTRHFLASMQATVRLGTIIDCPFDTCLEESVELAFISTPEVDFGHWSTYPSVSATVVNGWTRYNNCDVFAVHFSAYISRPRHDTATWLAQANHIFCCLGLTTNYGDCVFISWIEFTLVMTATNGPAPPEGYLFVCPPTDLRVGPESFRWPDCPAYWSLDPSGRMCLSTEEASQLGFPDVALETHMGGHSWDASVYAGLRKFHDAKGFDPDSQDVAKHLGLSLIHLCSEPNILFAPVDASDLVNSESGFVSGGEEGAGGLDCNECKDPVVHDQDMSQGLESVPEPPPIDGGECEPLTEDEPEQEDHDSESQTPGRQDKFDTRELSPTGSADLTSDASPPEKCSHVWQWLDLVKAALFIFLAVSSLKDYMGV